MLQIRTSSIAIVLRTASAPAASASSTDSTATLLYSTANRY